MLNDNAAALRRLEALTPLSPQAREVLVQATIRSRGLPMHRDLVREGRPVGGTLLILSGWGARVRELADGRRQILNLLLPGDLVGQGGLARPLASSTVASLSELRYCIAPKANGLADLETCYAVSQALDEAHLLAQITRLGRLNAQERLLDLFLELRQRLRLCQLVMVDGRSETFPFLLTQEMLADTTGLTPVHINRTLQQLRRRGDITLQAGQLTLIDPNAMAERVGYHSPCVIGRIG